MLKDRPAPVRAAAAPAALALVLALRATALAATPAAGPAPAAPQPGAAPQAAAPVTPETVPVTTSRGAFDLVVYAPRPPAPAGAPADSKPVVLLVSGEGGWKSFDVLLSQILSDEGYWVGGVDAKAYFWDPQDDRGLLAADIRSFATALQKAAGRPGGGPLILAGYSFGADLAPWIGGAAGWGGRVKGLLLIGPDENGSLAFRYTEMIGIKYKDHAFSVTEALKSSAGIPTVFIHGSKDGWSKAPELHEATSEPKKLIVIPDATHHFGGHQEELRSALRQGMEWLTGPRGAADARGSGR